MQPFGDGGIGVTAFRLSWMLFKAAPLRQDLQLVDRARSGDADALATLFAGDRRKLMKILLRLLRDRQDREEALQDGLLSAYLNPRSFEGRSRFLRLG
jgi:RNA polymerase sigma-70 factor, ECF subfamily